MPVRRRDRSRASEAARSKAASSGSGAICAITGGSTAPPGAEEQVAERPLIGEAQVRAAVAEGEPDPDVRRQRLGPVADQQLAAHAQVGEQRVVAGRQPQVLAAAPRRRR